MNGLAYITQYLPGKFTPEGCPSMSEKLKDFLQNPLDPTFTNLNKLPSQVFVHCIPFEPRAPDTERLIANAAIVHWGLKGYAAVLKMCLTNQQIQWGMATSDEDGENVGKWFMARGVELNDPERKTKVGTNIFNTKEGNPWALAANQYT